ncbi:unnamed protein product [Camellia sinensis]
MASIASNVTPNPNPNTNVVVLSLRKPLSCAFASNSSFFGNKFIGKSLSASIQRKRSDTARFAGLAPINASSSSHSFDVVIVGAGIIGMSIARQFLLESDLSVAVVDAAVPCSGATGADLKCMNNSGQARQGYLWMVHKEPGNDKWELAMRSRKLWEMMAENVQQQGMNPLEILGWKKTEIKAELSNRAEIDERTMNDNHEEEQLRQSRDKSIGSRSQAEAVARELLVARSLQSNQTNHREEKVDSGTPRGSLLVGKTPKQSAMLKRKVDQLSEAGLRAEFLSSCDLLLEEPALMVGEEGGAAFLPDDCQLDAQCTVAFIEKANRHFASEGRYAEFYHQPATSLLRSGSGEVKAVQTSKNILYSKKVVVIATGCWSGSLMHDLIGDSDIHLDVPVKPRKGHLLVLENLNAIKLNHGLMEVGYVDHEAAALDSSVSASGPVHAQISSISMTATMDAWGNLVLVNIKLLEVFELTEGVRKLKASLKYMDLICNLLSDGSKRIIVVGSGPPRYLFNGFNAYTFAGLRMEEITVLVRIYVSSRQFVGFDTEIDESIINRIWERAVEFFPALIEFSLRDFRESREVRIGLRPYMPDGKPMIGPVPGLSNLFLAAGHEGEGLSLALGTAEMVANMVLGNPGKVDHAPFALESRSCMFK